MTYSNLSCVPVAEFGPALVPGEVWVAAEIRHPDGTVVPCPAAPLLAGHGFRARTGLVRLLPAGTPQ
ncbi:MULTISPECIES: hypothetical protein [Streptomyces]|uniref:Uncharacterized protein n=1 Tax=Streptomyces kasugaensis TaxID=1946 RepID=A0A4V2JJ80_STRKA|nr:hypothetical protein [Streptomyces kasugaensis]TBO60741.1 hypothetical protein EYS09_05050 [Streptomyces kasugaensis]